jgi:hypothetical protein
VEGIPGSGRSAELRDERSRDVPSVVINLKTAKKLALTIPGPLRLRADQVIE